MLEELSQTGLAVGSRTSVIEAKSIDIRDKIAKISAYTNLFMSSDVHDILRDMEALGLHKDEPHGVLGPDRASAVTSLMKAIVNHPTLFDDLHMKAFHAVAEYAGLDPDVALKNSGTNAENLYTTIAIVNRQRFMNSCKSGSSAYSSLDTIQIVDRWIDKTQLSRRDTFLPMALEYELSGDYRKQYVDKILGFARVTPEEFSKYKTDAYGEVASFIKTGIIDQTKRLDVAEAFAEGAKFLHTKSVSTSLDETLGDLSLTAAVARADIRNYTASRQGSLRNNVVEVASSNLSDAGQIIWRKFKESTGSNPVYGYVRDISP